MEPLSASILRRITDQLVSEMSTPREHTIVVPPPSHESFSVFMEMMGYSPKQIKYMKENKALQPFSTRPDEDYSSQGIPARQ